LYVAVRWERLDQVPVPLNYHRKFLPLPFYGRVIALPFAATQQLLGHADGIVPIEKAPVAGKRKWPRRRESNRRERAALLDLSSALRRKVTRPSWRTLPRLA
jgi:hypothetical protein